MRSAAEPLARAHGCIEAERLPCPPEVSNPAGAVRALPTLGAVARPERGASRRLPGWLAYTVLRILFFVVPLVLTYGFSANVYVAAIVAAVVGFCLSLIFLNRQRIELAGELAGRRRRAAAGPRRDSDEAAEDAAVETRLVETPAIETSAIDDVVVERGGDQAGSASARPSPAP